ncbi:MAG: nickel-dependent lactate racemase [Clostridia bacterium]|nr:nickel-dependent lactate racemase [Clostridia bacterium]
MQPTTTLRFPYGKGHREITLPQARVQAVLTSALHAAGRRDLAAQQALVRAALASPIGSAPLHELAQGKKNIVIIASDHTRPVPSRAILPPMLEEIRRGSPDADITLLIATGCHRGTTRDELAAKLGEDLMREVRICVHDCDDTEMLVDLGKLPSGGPLTVNRLAIEADLLVSEGFIEPHFFAGFSGGRKSVLPGIAARASVMANHCAEFIDSPRARTGLLVDNPIHRDMVWAARQAKLAFIVNVVINAEKEAIYAVAGDVEAAHEAGCAYLSGLCQVPAAPADIVITSNGGYPLDQNIYQAVKGMTAAEACVREGGVIIMLAASSDGHGGKGFFAQLSQGEPDALMQQILARSRSETIPDQWQVQIFLRVLKRARVIYVSDAPDEMVRALHMTPAHSLEEAISIADRLLGTPNATVTAIPDGVAVMVV